MTLIATATFFLVRNPKDTSPENQPQTSDPDITQLADVRQPGTGEFKTNSNRERSVRKKTSPASVAAAMSRKATAPTGDLEKLQLRYGTTDTRILFEREVLAKNFRSAEKLIDELPDEFKNSVKGILYRIRIHKARGNTTALRILFNTTSIDDGQYLYEKANFSFERGELDKALSLIGKSMTTPSVLAEASVVEKKGTVLKARILTGIYYLDGQERSRKKALDAWFSVKFRLRNNQDHPDFLLANTNIRLLSHGGT